MLAVDAQVFRRFARNRSALLGGLLTGVLLATAVFAPVIKCCFDVLMQTRYVAIPAERHQRGIKKYWKKGSNTAR